MNPELLEEMAPPPPARASPAGCQSSLISGNGGVARLIIVLLRDPKDPKDQRIGKEPTNQVIFGPLGPFEHRYTKRLRELNRTPNANYDTFRKAIENPDPAVCANVIIGLIKVTTYLLDNQIRRLEEDFVKKGGLRERMTRARLNERDTKRKKDDS